MASITRRFEEKGLRLAALKLVRASRSLAEQHYAVHKGKPFYDSLLQFLTAGPTVAMFAMPDVSHVRRMLPLVRGLAGRGLDVRVLTGERFRELVEQAGGGMGSGRRAPAGGPRGGGPRGRDQRPQRGLLAGTEGLGPEGSGPVVAVGGQRGEHEERDDYGRCEHGAQRKARSKQA